MLCLNRHYLSIIFAALTAGASCEIIPNAFPNGWPYLQHCRDPHAPGGLLNKTLGMCAPGGLPDFNPGAKVAVVGGGPAGVSMSKLLSDRGYNVTLYERTGRIGGKSKSTFIGSEAHDLGTCYLAGKYECIELWIAEAGMHEVKVDSRRISSTRARLFDMAPPRLGTEDEWAVDFAHRRYAVRPEDFNRTLRADVATYIAGWTASFGQTEYMFPSEETVNKAALNQSFIGWLEAHGITALIPHMIFAMAGQGYGSARDIPAFYGLMWLHPNFFGGNATHSMLLGGFELLWQRLLAATSTTVRLRAQITAIARQNTSVHITWRRAADATLSTETFDWLVLASPMPESLSMLSDATEEELALFSSFRVRELSATIGELHNGGGYVPDNVELLTWADRVDAQSDYYVAKRDIATGVTSYEPLLLDSDDGPVTLRHTANILGFEHQFVGVLQISKRETSTAGLRALIDPDLAACACSTPPACLS